MGKHGRDIVVSEFLGLTVEVNTRWIHNVTAGTRAWASIATVFCKLTRFTLFRWGHKQVGIVIESSGDSEADFWSQLLPDTTNNTDAIAYELFEGIVPAIVCNDFEDFLAHLNKATSIGTKINEEEQQSKETKKCYN